MYKNHDNGVLLIKNVNIIIIRKCKERISLIANVTFKAFQWRLKLEQWITSEFHNFHHIEYNHSGGSTVLTTCGLKKDTWNKKLEEVYCTFYRWIIVD